MEQQTKDDTTASNTSPSKRLKQHHSTTETPGLEDINQKSCNLKQFINIFRRQNKHTRNSTVSAAYKNWYNEL